MCSGAPGTLRPQMGEVGRTGGKFLIYLPPSTHSLLQGAELAGDTTHLLGKVGEDLGTDPIQPLDDFSLEQTHRCFSPPQVEGEGAGKRYRPVQEVWGSKRDQLSPGWDRHRGQRAPNQWQRQDLRRVLGPAANSADTGPNPDWATWGLGGPEWMMPREHLVGSEHSMGGREDGDSNIIIL